MKTKIFADFQICISAPLKTLKKENTVEILVRQTWQTVKIDLIQTEPSCQK